jgi:hypothetical protein
MEDVILRGQVIAVVAGWGVVPALHQGEGLVQGGGGQWVPAPAGDPADWQGPSV